MIQFESMFAEDMSYHSETKHSHNAKGEYQAIWRHHKQIGRGPHGLKQFVDGRNMRGSGYLLVLLDVPGVIRQTQNVVVIMRRRRKPGNSP
jgi:hypothetical protein